MISSLRHSWRRWVEEPDQITWLWRAGCILIVLANAFVIQMILLATL